MNKVLIVDDSKTILNRLKEAVESLGIEAITATSMKECAEVLLKHKGDFLLALLDFSLPDAQNGEIVSFIKKFNIPTILLTGSSFDKSHDIFKNDNLIDYIQKNGSYAIEYTMYLTQRLNANSQTEVLIVDDSKTFAAKMDSLCSKYKLNTVVSYNPKEALEVLDEKARVKLILVDYMMPEMNGLEFITEVRKKYKKDEIAIIALSGTSEKEIVADFLKYGANDFLYKDFTTDEFFARVNSNLEVMALFESTRDKAKKDDMTGLFNRNYLFSIGEELYERAKVRNEKFAVALLSIDNFKTFNDSYGHDLGDLALQEVAKILNKYLNKGSLISRLGGKEFCILLKNRPYAEVFQTFNEIREAFEKNKIKTDLYDLSYTVSIGFCVEFGENLDDMIKMADQALFDAKEAGKNKVLVYNEPF